MFGWARSLHAAPLENPADLITPSEDPREVQQILDELSERSEDGNDRSLLHPANTSSPRDTIVSFIKLTQRFYNLISSEDYSVDDRAEVMHLFGEIQDFFDMREVPPSLRADYASAAGIYLREVIDREGLPDYLHIPGEIAMRDAIADGQPPRWQIPVSLLKLSGSIVGPRRGATCFRMRPSNWRSPFFSGFVTCRTRVRLRRISTTTFS